MKDISIVSNPDGLMVWSMKIGSRREAAELILVLYERAQLDKQQVIMLDEYTASQRKYWHEFEPYVSDSKPNRFLFLTGSGASPHIAKKILAEDDTVEINH